MEAPAVVDGGGGGGVGVGGRRQQQPAGMGQMLTGIIRIAVFWYFASKFFGPKRSPTQSTTQISNLFHKGEPLVGYFSLISFWYILWGFVF